MLGIRYACISPGLRNSPLTLAFTQNTIIKVFSNADERSAGFFALGLAKATGEPVVLLCTSGTAGANYYPAVIEANLSRTPLIVLTADRPHDLVGTGANQTIDQQNLFGQQVRYFRDVGLPESHTENLVQFVISSALFSRGMDSEGNYKNPPGPVHLNIPFDEPLLPETLPGQAVEMGDVILPRRTEQVPEASDFLDIPPCTLIVAGEMIDNSGRDSIIQLAEHYNLPILADPLSQLRFGYSSEKILTKYDLFLREIQPEPSLILRFGKKPNSKILCLYLDRYKSMTNLVDSTGRFNDDCPVIVKSPVNSYCESLIKNQKANSNCEWLDKWLLFESTVNKIVNKPDFKTAWFEGNHVLSCVDSISAGENLIIGNSMPVRDLDMFGGKGKKQINIFANRGASGIDGVVSTAIGIAAANPGVNNYLIIGDLSFFHDMNGLLTAKRYPVNLTIVVINNKGGGIFTFLPVSDQGINSFEEFWTTPPDLDISLTAKQYDGSYFYADSVSDLKIALDASKLDQGLSIIEVHSHTGKNVEIHKHIQDQISSALK